MTEITDLTVVDANNTGRWPIGMTFGAVDESGRADEGLLARWYADTNGSLIATGAANAYAITANRALASYLDKWLVAFQPNTTNTGAATLNVSGLGNITITRPDGTALLAGDIVAGQVVTVIYIAALNKFQLLAIPAAGQQVAIPVGTILAWPTSTIPTGMLECNGQTVSRTTFAALFAAIGVAYGAGDGSTTFAVPDYRGYFLRGQDHGAARDPDAGARTARADGTAGDNPGTTQAHQVGPHGHPGSTASVTDPGHVHAFSGITTPLVFGAGASSFVVQSGASTPIGNTSIASATTGITVSVTIAVTTTTETRPVNINVVWVIVATPAAALPTSGIGTVDMWVGARNMTASASNGATSATRDTATNHLTQPVFQFSNTTQQFVVFEWRPPKRWNKGTVTFIPHWLADAGTPGNNVQWQLAALARNDGGAMDVAPGTAQTSTEALAATGDQQIGPESAAITIAGTLNSGCHVIFVLSRNVGVANNLAAVAQLLGAVIRWTANAVSDT